MSRRKFAREIILTDVDLVMSLRKWARQCVLNILMPGDVPPNVCASVRIKKIILTPLNAKDLIFHWIRPKVFFCHRVKGDPCIFLVLPFGERISDLKHLCSVYVFAPIPLLCIGDLRGV